MKRLLCVIVVIFTAFSAFSLGFSAFQSAFEQFAQDVASTLPFNAATGLSWSDAYIGQLFALPPHLGVGLTVGFTTIPSTAVSQVLTALGSPSVPAAIDFVKTLGLPLPAYAIDARIGGLFLPFDIGLKIGAMQSAGADFSFDYLLAGADIRYAILQENILLPSISIGAGFNYIKGGVALGGLFPGGLTLASINAPGPGSPYTLDLTDPALAFEWETSVIDLKVQVSKSLLIITPYLGAGASFGSSSAGGGVTSSLKVNGSAPTAQQITDITQYLQANGDTINLSDKGVTVLKSVSGWAFRVFGGVSLNILMIRLDLGAMYNLSSGSIGASGNARIQF